MAPRSSTTKKQGSAMLDRGKGKKKPDPPKKSSGAPGRGAGGRGAASSGRGYSNPLVSGRNKMLSAGDSISMSDCSDFDDMVIDAGERGSKSARRGGSALDDETGSDSDFDLEVRLRTSAAYR
eukprot:scaffold272162_cov26-Tisochrysis_lutea.AAC.2